MTDSGASRAPRRKPAAAAKTLSTGFAISATLAVTAALGHGYQQEAGTQATQLALDGVPGASPATSAAQEVTPDTTASATPATTPDLGAPARVSVNDATAQPLSSTPAANTPTTTGTPVQTQVPEPQPIVVQVPPPTAPAAPPTTRSA